MPVPVPVPVPVVGVGCGASKDAHEPPVRERKFCARHQLPSRGSITSSLAIASGLLTRRAIRQRCDLGIGCPPFFFSVIQNSMLYRMDERYNEHY